MYLPKVVKYKKSMTYVIYTEVFEESIAFQTVVAYKFDYQKIYFVKNSCLYIFLKIYLFK